MQSKWIQNQLTDLKLISQGSLSNVFSFLDKGTKPSIEIIISDIQYYDDKVDYDEEGNTYHITQTVEIDKIMIGHFIEEETTLVSEKWVFR